MDTSLHFGQVLIAIYRADKRFQTQWFSMWCECNVNMQIEKNPGHLQLKKFANFCKAEG